MTLCRILVVLHQQHREPALLRSVQRKLPPDVLAHTDVSLGRVTAPVGSCRSAPLHNRHTHRRASTWPAAARTHITSRSRAHTECEFRLRQWCLRRAACTHGRRMVNQVGPPKTLAAPVISPYLMFLACTITIFVTACDINGLFRSP